MHSSYCSIRSSELQISLCSNEPISNQLTCCVYFSICCHSIISLFHFSPSPSSPPLPPRDRVSLIWGDVSLHLSRLVLISEHDSYLRERALVGLLKIVNRLTNRDDVRSEVRTGWQFEHTYSTCTRSDCVVCKIHIRTWKYCSCVGVHRVFIQRH